MERLARAVTVVLLTGVVAATVSAQAVQLDLSGGFNMDCWCGPKEMQAIFNESPPYGAHDLNEFQGDLPDGVGWFVLAQQWQLVGNSTLAGSGEPYSIEGQWFHARYLDGTDGTPEDGVVAGEELTYHIASALGNATLPDDWLEAAAPVATWPTPPLMERKFNSLLVGAAHNTADWQIAAVTAWLPAGQRASYTEINFILAAMNTSDKARNVEIHAVYSADGLDTELLYAFSTAEGGSGPVMDDTVGNDASGDFQTCYAFTWLYNCSSGTTGAVSDAYGGGHLFEFADALPLNPAKVLHGIKVADGDPGLNNNRRGVVIFAATAELPTPEPTADAGADQIVHDVDRDGAETVTLDGSGSYDADGTIVSWSWEEADVEIATGETAQVSLTPGVHTITLTVTDNETLTGSDVVVVEVNVPPVADAGPDQEVSDDEGDLVEEITLDGAASSDGDGTIAGWVWTEGGDQIATGETPLVALGWGEHTIVLTVTDDDGGTDTDTVVVTITGNYPPTADAGPDRVLYDDDDTGAETAVLDGSGSGDVDGTIASWVWEEGEATIATGETAEVSLALGEHTITLTVTDNQGAIGTDTVVVMVTDRHPPAADAGSDAIVADEDDDGQATVTLDGSASSDADGTIVSYSWRNPGGAEIATGETAGVDLDVGINDITLLVTDDEGDTGSTVVRIWVMPHVDYWVDQNHPDASDSNPGTEVLPWLTVDHAVDSVGPGHVICVREGIYRERVTPGVSGTTGSPITLMGYPGERVVLSGADPITGWTQCDATTAKGNPHAASIYYADIPWRPTLVAQDAEGLQKAREPNVGWRIVTGGSTTTFTDTSLTDPDNYWNGGEVFMWFHVGTRQDLRRITGYVQSGGVVTVDSAWRNGSVPTGGVDRYCLLNKVEILDLEGDYAVEDLGGGTYRVYVWPLGDQDPNDCLMEGSRRGGGGELVVDFNRKNYWIYDNLEIRHGEHDGIGCPGYQGCSHNTVQNCVIHSNVRNELAPMQCDYGVYRRNVVCDDSEYDGDETFSIYIYTCNHVLFEQCEIGQGPCDGIGGMHGSDITVRGCYVHDNWYWAHPDNLQTWDNGQTIMVEDCLIVHAGQAFMVSDSDYITLSGNTIIGASAYMIPLSGTTDHHLFEHNTFIGSGYGILGSGGDDHTMCDNIVMTGHNTSAWSRDSADVYASDYNVFWQAADMAITRGPVIWDLNYNMSLAAYAAASGQDTHSAYANPQFTNAPVSFHALDGNRQTDFLPNRVYPRDGMDGLAVGDHIEIANDGVVRTITALGADWIGFSPSADWVVTKADSLFNWKTAEDFTWDLTLQPGSPAAGAASDGGDIGSSINIGQYKAGDFNGDGCRDLPEWPRHHFNFTLDVPDAGLRAAIAAELGKTESQVTLADLRGLGSLMASGWSITSLEGLQWCESLTTLDLQYNQVSDLGPLAALSYLHTLEMQYNQVSDLSPLAGLVNLTLLDLRENQVGDLAALVDNAGLGAGDTVYVAGNPLGLAALYVQIPDLQDRGVTVYFDLPGTVRAWGRNSYGQLGDGTTTNSPTPVQVVDPADPSGFLTDVAQVSCGYDYTVALKSDGTVWGWGLNYAGQLGDGTTVWDRHTPVQAIDPADPSGFLTDVVALAAGYSHTVAVKSDGTVWAWGDNSDGQLGDGTGVSSSTPVQVVDPSDGSGFLTGVVAVSGGGFHTVALKADGTVRVWGWNLTGQLGDGTTIDSPEPVQVVDPADGSGFLTGVAAVAGGDMYTVAVKDDGTVRSWGRNQTGQLGDGTTTNSPTPVQVVDPADGSGFLTGVLAVSSGGDHTAALKGDGTVWGWGMNSEGQLGDGTVVSSPTPVQVVDPEDGSGYLTGVVAVAAGNLHTLAAKGDGTVRAWGDNDDGQLGDGTTTGRPLPVEVTGARAISAVAAGPAHSLAVVGRVFDFETSVPDAGLRAAICDELGKAEGAVTAIDLYLMTTLDAEDRGIESLEGLQLCESLEKLLLNKNLIDDLTPLAGLVNLTDLGLGRNEISDITSLASLVNLERVDLDYNQIEDAGPLAGLTALRYVRLCGNPMSDLSPFAGLVNLRELYVYGSPVSDLTPLAGLVELRRLYADGDDITDLSPLAGLVNMTHLVVDSSQVSELSPLAGLTQMFCLQLRSNQISDATPLAAMTNLYSLDLSYNQVSDIAPLAGLTQLEELWMADNPISDHSCVAGMTDLAYLDLSFTGMTDLTPLAGMVDMKWLFLAENQITDVADLVGMASLELLVLDDNQVSNLAPLAALTTLDMLYLRGNQVSDLSALTSLVNLMALGLEDNQVTDLAPLVDNSGLDSGDTVNVTGNPLSGLAFCVQIPALEARGVTVDYDVGDFDFPGEFPDANLRAAICAQLGKAEGDVAPGDLRTMTALNAGAWDIVDLQGLQLCRGLAALDLSGNQIVDLAPLVDNPGLDSGDTVDVTGNPLGLVALHVQMPQLEGRGVDVTPDAPAWDFAAVMPDAALRAEVCSKLGKDEGDVTAADLYGMTGTLSAASQGITNVEGLQLCRNLGILSLSGNNISDLAPLSGLVNLWYLAIHNNALSDLAPLAGLVNLTNLGLGSNQISDLSPLANLVNLVYLELNDNQIADISPLAGLTRLEYVHLYRNQVSDLTPLAGLECPWRLLLSDNLISDLSPLAGLVDLQQLSLDRNLVTSLAPIGGLTNLYELSAAENQISDPSPVADMVRLQWLNLLDNQIVKLRGLMDNTGLGTGDAVELWDNPLGPVALYVDIPELLDRGVTMVPLPPSFEFTTVFPDANLRAAICTGLGKAEGAVTVADLQAMTALGAEGGGIQDLEGLQLCEDLASLDVSNNLIEDLAALVGNAGLGTGDVLNVGGNPLSATALSVQIPELGARGVTVIVNAPPVADAGLDQEVTDDDGDGSETVTLDGSASSDADGTIVSWVWREDDAEIAAGETAPVTLAVGEHTITLIVTDNGGATGSDTVVVNVAPRVFDLTVEVPDANLRAAICDELGKAEGDVTLTDLEGMTSLNAMDDGVASLEGLQLCQSLDALRLSGNQISDLTPLAGLTTLTTILLLSDNQISDISALSGLTNLKKLTMDSNQVSDLSPVAGMTSLAQFQARWNQFNDLSPLAGLPSLQLLNLAGNQISDLTPLASLPSLTDLTLDDNQISDLSPLAGLTTLTRLSLRTNQIADLTPLAGLTNVVCLYLDANQISDLTGLGGVTGVRSLYLNSNQVSDLTPLAGLPSLYLLRLNSNQLADLTPLASVAGLKYLWLRENQIVDLTPLASLGNLQDVYLDDNQVSDLTPLAGMASLNRLYLDSNKIDDLAPLAGLTGLQRLYLQFNQVNDLTPLAGLTGLSQLYLASNHIVDLAALVDNAGLASGDTVDVTGNPLSPVALYVQMPELEAHGVDMVPDAPAWDFATAVPDAGLRAAICTELGKAEAAVTLNDLQLMTELDAATCGIESLEGLQLSEDLTDIDLSYNQIVDLSPLVGNAGLASGDTVDVTGNPLNALARYVQVPELEARGVDVVPDAPAWDFAAAVPDANLRAAICDELGKTEPQVTLADLQAMTALDAEGSGVANIEGLQLCDNLVVLNLAWNDLADLVPLANLVYLGALNLSGNQIVDVGPLATLTHLVCLELHENAIADIAALEHLVTIQELYLCNNQVTDLAALVANAGMDDGDLLEVWANPLSPTALDDQIPALEARGVVVVAGAPLEVTAALEDGEDWVYQNTETTTADRHTSLATITLVSEASPGEVYNVSIADDDPVGCNFTLGTITDKRPGQQELTVEIVGGRTGASTPGTAGAAYTVTLTVEGQTSTETDTADVSLALRYIGDVDGSGAPGAQDKQFFNPVSYTHLTLPTN